MAKVTGYIAGLTKALELVQPLASCWLCMKHGGPCSDCLTRAGLAGEIQAEIERAWEWQR